MATSSIGSSNLSIPSVAIGSTASTVSTIGSLPVGAIGSQNNPYTAGGTFQSLATLQSLTNVWQTYVPTYSDSSAGAKCNSTIDSASYMINGKTITLIYTFKSAGTGGGVVTGTTGRFSLPAGVTFDTTKITLDTQTAYSTPLLGSVLGSANAVDAAGTNATQYIGVSYAFSSTQFGMQYMAVNAPVASNKWGSVFDFGVAHLGANANDGFSIQITAPIN